MSDKEIKVKKEQQVFFVAWNKEKFFFDFVEKETNFLN